MPDPFETYLGKAREFVAGDERGWKVEIIFDL